MSPGLVIGIDASRNRSGGAIAHLRGLLENANPRRHGFTRLHVWVYGALVVRLPKRDWISYHSPAALEGNILRQLFWQRTRLGGEARAAGCDIMLNTDAGTVGRFHPAVTMSRDMLSYEPGEIERYGFGKARLRLFLLRHVQNRSLVRAEGAIFLTRYAGEVIQRSCGTLRHKAYVPHGVGESFKMVRPRNPWPQPGDRDVRCVYVSNAAPYKHQDVVVRAIGRLRAEGYPVSLTLVGAGAGRTAASVAEQVARSDPSGAFVTVTDFIAHDLLPEQLAEADLFVFASSCENMPNTLLEGMAVGLPIASSNRGPMPEVLEDGGVYFDPEDESSVATAIASLIDDPELRDVKMRRARELADAYSWQRCADETFGFLRNVYEGTHA